MLFFLWRGGFFGNCVCIKEQAAEDLLNGLILIIASTLRVINTRYNFREVITLRRIHADQPLNCLPFLSAIVQWNNTPMPLVVT